jgi:colanic acid/amylovoran biosynthesis glycosyltransferase
MKIAFLVWRFPVVSEPFILNQIVGLLDRGHEVDIYPLNGKPVNLSKIHPLVKRYRLLERTYYPLERPESDRQRAIKGLGLLLKHIPQDSIKLLNRAKLFKYDHDVWSLKWLYRAMLFLPKKEYDIIHCQFGTLSAMGLLFRDLGILTGKLVVTFRGIDISNYVQEKGDRVYDELFAQGDFFLANCDFFRQKALMLGCNPRKTVVHGSGIDCCQFAFKPRCFPDDGRVQIATTGRLVEKKGIKYCIDAIAKLLPSYPRLEFNIIGDGELKDKLEQQISELNLANSVKLLGWKQQTEIIEILDKCHIFLAPSITAADGNQDAPVNTLKEAMAMGLPVISTYHGGIPELVEDGISGFLVPERDTDAIAQKLEYLVQHPELWQQMGRAGRDRVLDKYDMEKLNDELVQIYQNLLPESAEIIPKTGDEFPQTPKYPVAT